MINYNLNKKKILCWQLNVDCMPELILASLLIA